MTKTKLDKGFIDILSRALFMGNIDEASLSYLAIEYVKYERYKMENEYTLLESFIINQAEMLAFDSSYLEIEVYKNQLNGALTLLKMFDRNAAKIRIESLLKDGNFNPVMNSIYHMSLDSKNNLEINAELLKGVFWESDIVEVVEIINRVHKIRTPEKQMEYLKEEI